MGLPLTCQTQSCACLRGFYPTLWTGVRGLKARPLLMLSLDSLEEWPCRTSRGHQAWRVLQAKAWSLQSHPPLLEQPSTGKSMPLLIFCALGTTLLRLRTPLCFWGPQNHGPWQWVLLYLTCVGWESQSPRGQSFSCRTLLMLSAKAYFLSWS